MKKTIWVCLLFLCSSVLVAQDLPREDVQINRTDKKGMKQGVWKKYYPDGSPLYEGRFVNDRPVGLLRRYYESGGISAELYYLPDSHKVRAKIYYENGTLAGEGNYLGTKKDSTWRYYSYYGGYLSQEENYRNGIKEGITRKYYPSGGLSEITGWKEGQKNGIWIRYYEDGTVQVRSDYEAGRLNGTYLQYHSNGNLRVRGMYVGNHREGFWEFFDSLGKPTATIEFLNGVAKNKAALDKTENAYLDSLDRFKGRLDDPTLEEIMNLPSSDEGKGGR